ncbi:MAG: hypothetical protein JW708_11880 [Vallitaleaceae bacterium]|nr:hypothetical protein [Vallitaleaceae bacterium]
MKKLWIYLLTFILLLSMTACVPTKYKKGVDYDDYPKEQIPIDKDMVVFDFEGDEESGYDVKAGSRSSVEEVIEFYQDFFEENEVSISDEDGDDEVYYFEGFYEGYRFVLDIYTPLSSIEKKAFQSIIEISLSSSAISSGTKVRFVETEMAEEAEATFNQAGGRIDLPSDSRLSGSYVVVPEASIDQDVRITIGTVVGEFRDAPESVSDVAFYLDTENYNDFARPLEVTIKYADTAEERAKTPIGYYIDKEGRFNQVMIKSINQDEGTFTFYTFHASTYTYAFLDDFSEASGSGDSGFRPSADGFTEVNNGSSKYSGGECYGMSTFAKWYYLNKKGTEGNLTPKFLTPDMGTSPSGDVIRPQDIIATRAFQYTNQQSKVLWTTELQFSSRVSLDANGNETYVRDNEVAALCILDSLDFFKEPVEIGIYGNGGHSVLGYRYEKTETEVKIYIYDPNYPKDDNQFITYKIADKTFKVSGYADGQLNSELTCTGFGTFSMVAEYEKILEDAKNNFASTPAHLEITSHTDGQEVTETTIVLEGKVDTFENMGEQIGTMVEVITQEGQIYKQFLTDNGTAAKTFAVELPLKSGDNNFLINIIYWDEDLDDQYLATDLYGYFNIKALLPDNVIYVTLTWDNQPDVDLHVIDPTGAEAWYQNYVTPDGGELDIDDTSSYGPEHFTLTNEDIVRWGEEYQVRLHYYYGEAPTYYTVTVQANMGTANETYDTYSGVLGQTGDWVDICSVIPIQN